MSARGPRLEFAVGAFLLLALASLLVLAIASTNGKFGFGDDSYQLKARFTNLGQLRPMAPVKIGGVAIGKVASIELDREKLDAVAILDIDSRYNNLSIDTSASILTGGLLGESYVGLQPGGAVETLKAGNEIAFTTPAVDLIQMVGKYIFGGTGTKPAEGDSNPEVDSNPSSDTPSPAQDPTP